MAKDDVVSDLQTMVISGVDPATGKAQMVVVDANGNLVVGGSSTTTTTEARPATAVLTNVAGSVTTGVLKASNLNRLGLYIHNDSTANLYVAFAATATTSAFTVKIAAGGYYEMPRPVYTGAISGIWDAANGSARVTEVTA